MTIVTVSESSGTAEEYEAMNAALEQAGAPKPLVHIASPVEGGFRVINVWESQADVDAVVQLAGQYVQSQGWQSNGPDAIIRRTINPVYRLVVNMPMA
jgi:hypothetical protein